MSTMTKALAVALVLLALLLAGAAIRMALTAGSPPPQAIAPTVVEVPSPPASRDLYPVAVAARDIPAGRPLEDADIQIVQWPVVPARGFADADGLRGEWLREAVAAGEPLTRRLLAQGLARQLQPGERAIAMSVDEVIGAGNRIAPGDLVDVFFTLGIDNREIEDSQARLLLARVRVLAYGAQSVDGEAAEERGGSSRSGGAPVARTAMLAVPLAEVNAVLLAMRSGKLQLALRAPEDAEVPDARLFLAREPVLQPRAGLSGAQSARLGLAVNQAYAGESLSEVAAARRPEPEPAIPAEVTQPRPAPPPRGRSVEVIRGSSAQVQQLGRP